MTRRALTVFQQHLVGGHVEQARAVARSTFHGDDEYEGVALEALCTAAVQWHDDGRSSFSHYMNLIIRRALLDFHRDWNKKRIRRPLTKVALTDEVDVADDRPPLDMLIAEHIDAAALAARIDPWVRRRAAMVADGATQREVGAAYGVTGAAISAMFKTESRRLAG